MAPHILLNPNATVTKKQRKQLPWPLPVKPVYMIKQVIKHNLVEAAKVSAAATNPTPIPGPVVVVVTIAYDKGRIIPDFDNAVATLKGAIDGVTEGGFMRNDKQVIGIFLRMIKDPAKQGYIDLTVREATPEEVREYEEGVNHADL
jgi:Holliday junction resolvase RusA-like endonuclease